MVLLGHMHTFSHHGGGHGKFAAAAALKIVIILLAFILAVVARYAAIQWGMRRFDDELKANAAGWLAFFAVLIVIGIGGVELL